MLHKARYQVYDDLSIEVFTTKDRPFKGSISCQLMNHRGQATKQLVYFTTFGDAEKFNMRLGNVRALAELEGKLTAIAKDYLKEHCHKVVVIRINYATGLRHLLAISEGSN